MAFYYIKENEIKTRFSIALLDMPVIFVTGSQPM